MITLMISFLNPELRDTTLSISERSELSLYGSFTIFLKRFDYETDEIPTNFEKHIKKHHNTGNAFQNFVLVKYRFITDKSKDYEFNLCFLS